jgi:hypothetical protein
MGYMEFNPGNGTQGLAFGNGSTEYVRMTSGGNVGIGTTSPGYLLDVNGSMRIQSGTYIGGSGSLNSAWALNYVDGLTYKALIFGNVNSLNNAAEFSYNHISAGSTSNYVGLGFYGAINKLAVTAGGNVGIGTTSPSYTLHASTSGIGSIIAQTTSSSNFSQIGCLNSSGVFSGMFMNGSGRTADGGANTTTVRNDIGPLRLCGAGDSPNIYLDNAGQAVVIGRNGTSYVSPCCLHLAKNSGVTTQLSWECTGYATAAISISQSTFTMGAENKDITFRTGCTYNGDYTSTGTERMRITQSGRVGIGTTAPEAPLHVVQQTLSFYFPNSYTAFYYGGYTNIGGPFTAAVAICAYFSGGRIVVGGEMDALSDRRKKTDIKTLESALDDIRKVRITTYKMIDDGSQEYGVISQELSEIYPLMVKKNGVEFLPTSDCPARIIQVTDELVGITFDKFTDITVDDKVRIVLENNTKQELKVERVTVSGIYFKKWDKFDESQKIYVYGKEHRDVQTVTKNALFMANIRATQELAEKVDRLEAQNKLLHARLEALEKLLMKE